VIVAPSATVADRVLRIAGFSEPESNDSR